VGLSFFLLSSSSFLFSFNFIHTLPSTSLGILLSALARRCQMICLFGPELVALSHITAMVRRKLTTRADEAHQGRVTLDYNQFVSPISRIADFKLMNRWTWSSSHPASRLFGVICDITKLKV